jgi:hypothetical protein
MAVLASLERRSSLPAVGRLALLARGHARGHALFSDRLSDNLSCHRLNMALRSICMDDMGREAVREGLKLVKLKNVKDKSDMRIAFDGGVLEMHCAYALRTDGMYSDNEIREVLMAKL